MNLWSKWKNLKKRGYENVSFEDDDIDGAFIENMYFAMKFLHISEDEFWHMNPIEFDNLLETHLKFERSKYQYGR